MRKKLKILLVNSYSFEKIYDNWRKGINPSHYLMGKVELDKFEDFEVTILKHERFSWLNKIGDFLKLPFLDQQVRALWALRTHDILYLPYPLSNSRLITTLKWVGLISTPIVVLVHQNILTKPGKKTVKNFFGRKRFLQYDAFAFFSKNLLQKIKKDMQVSNKVVEKKFFHVNWGADSDFYPQILPNNGVAEEKFAVCAGTADRDFDLIIETFRGLDHGLKIFCTPSTVPITTNIPENVTIDTSWVPYNRLMQEYQKASFLLIPLKDEIKNKGNTYGLTVLLDALAMGKPVLMTYHKYIDIDIERENIGKWIKVNDVQDWSEKINQLLDNPEELKTMGENAKALHINKYNSGLFATEMAEIFRRVKN